MTDAEILAHQRAKHGNPYMPLSVAKEMQRFDRKWAHLGAEVARKRREGKISDPQPCRYAAGHARPIDGSTDDAAPDGVLPALAQPV